ncbi:MAG TPA: ABC transporter permease [Bryobacteraceae bacterium]|nr:ABC transporter permease [Bryobacteraceae bacterium]
METLLADLRQALRGLRRSPGFAAAAIGIMALGLAATTAVFSVADTVLFRPLPYEHPQQLVAINEVIPQLSQRYPSLPVNAKHFFEWQARCRSFADLAILREGAMNLTGNDGPPMRLSVKRISWNLFSLLGVQPLLGRNFTTEEDRPNNDHVVILTYGLWQRRFHGDAAILNKTVLLSGTPHTVVGVLGSGFRFPQTKWLGDLGERYTAPDIFTPFAIDRSKLDAMGNHNFGAIGRLREGVSPQQALADLDAVQAALIHENPMPGMDLRALVTPLQEQIVAGSRQGLLVLLASIAIVLLIICVNLGNLMLARSTARSREMAVRVALGAGSWRMFRQVLTESLAIALSGGALGLMLAYAAVRALVASAPVDLPRLDEVHLDLRALLFAFAVSVVAGLLFGLIPAWRAVHSEPQDALRGGGRSATQGRGGLRISEILVTSEVALSAALLVAAGLLIGSLVRILGIDQGFQANNVLTAGLNLPAMKYSDTRKRAAFFDRLLPALQRLPGVQAAGIVSTMPLAGDTWVDMITRDDDHRPVFERPVANFRFISPDYFAALGIPIRAGRPFQSADRNRPVVVVSATTAARIWPGANALGKHMRRSNASEPMAEVVGVVMDTRTGMKGDPPPLMVYIPYWSDNESGASLVIRTAQEPAAAAPAVRNAIWSVDSELPVSEMKTMQRIISDSVSERRFQTMLLAVFAVAALALALVGIYGVISYSVNLRRNEIAIRMALGARAAQVNRMVLGQGMRPVAAGLVIGIAVALGLGRLLQAMLFEIRPADPVVLGGVVVVLGVAAALACFAPARRATRTDPAMSLRYE